MAATHRLKGVIAILEVIHKISNYKSENLTMKNNDGSKQNSGLECIVDIYVWTRA